MNQPPIFLAALLAAGTLLTTTARAQVRLGLKAGASYSHVTPVYDGKKAGAAYDSKLGFHAGLLANYDVTGDGFFSVQPELLYSQKGYAVDQEYTTTYREGSITQTVVFKNQGPVNYNYLDLPVLLRINARGLIFEAGPQLSYLLSLRNKVKSTANDLDTGNARWSATLHEARRLELGYAAGLGYQSAAGPLFGLRYHGSFSQFGKSSQVYSTRNAAYQLYVGYLFGGQ